jgi:predicted phage terminase large subunit-like protein
MGKTFSLLKSDDIVYSCMNNQPFEYYVQSWDTAIKTSDTSDYSVCTVWGVAGEIYYLVDMIRSRMSYPELKSTALRLNSKYKPRVILIEDKASGQSLIQDLRSEGMGNIMPQKPKLDKITRFASTIPLFQASRVVVPTFAPWHAQFINEITRFPSSENDDIVDSVSQFLNYIKAKKNEPIKIRSI